MKIINIDGQDFRINMKTAITRELIEKVGDFRRIGQRFKNMDGVEYILAQVYIDKVALICLTTGNRYCDPITVKDCMKISEDEWCKITGYLSKYFQRIIE